MSPALQNQQQRRKRQRSTEDESDNEAEQSQLDLSDEEGGLRVDDIYIPPPPKQVNTINGAGTRLIITGIDNNFFKSYAEHQKLGPFHKCFNAIIGPNGSGKSNVIDSMLFVFGYRASKIRSKKLSVLLHNSESYKNIQSCTVAVHFALIIDKEGDDYELVPGSEFVVSRTANKDNSSYYEINGRRAQFKEVAKLLKSHGIDLDHNRFLILQGEVEQISMMKCKGANEHETGMLEYLEEIIGTSRYIAPLGQLEQKVEVLAEERSAKLNRVNLVKQELDELKEPMEEAVGFLKTENTVVVCKNFIYQKQIYNMEEATKGKAEAEAEIKSAHQELTEKLSSVTAEKKTQENLLKERSKRYESLENRKEATKEAFKKANNKDMQLLADMTNLNNKRKKTKHLLAEEQKNLEKLEKIPQQNEQTIAECIKKEAELSEKKEKLEADKVKLLASVRADTQELQEKKEKLQTELIELNVAVDHTKSEFALAESKLKLYLSKDESEAAKLANMREKYDANKKILSELPKEVETLKKKIPLTEKSLKSAMDELNAARREEAEIVNQVRTKRASLEETRSSMQASRSRGRVLDALLQQKRSGKCPGLFGRLGDLGAIDQKYDVAVSTACGPLDNIVVDTVETAQWCIEFLKANDIGKATFIALDKQEHLRGQAETPIVTPENVPRLVDLIRIEDERVRTAFFFALRNTLVANDLEQASRIAYGQQRYRVVTLKGDLIEMTGTMSGGGRTVSKGRMGQSVQVTNVNPKDLEKMESDLRSLEDCVRQLRQKQADLESQVAVLEPSLREMKINYEKYSRDLQALSQEQSILEGQLKAQEAKAKATTADPKEVKRLKAEVEAKKTEYEKAADTAAVLQTEVNQIVKEIEERTIGKIRVVDKSIKEVTTQLGKCKAEITRLNVAIKTSIRNMKNSREKIATMEQDIVKCEQDLKDMQAERDQTEQDAKELLKCVEAITLELEQGTEEFADVKKEVAALTKRENELKGEKIELDEKLKTATKAINECKVAIHQWRAKISHLKLEDIPNETVEPLKTYTHEELDSHDIQHFQNKLHAAEEQLKAVKPNMSAIEQYKKKMDVFIERSHELDAISEKKAMMKDLLLKVRNRRKDEFLVGFNIIKLKLKEMYQMITLGGDATLEMVDTFDPFSEGIQFNVRPPKKSWKIITNLSGGEKTLSSLALVFALHYYKPSPLYVMDEIDAALDFKNVSIVGNYIKERTKNAQFIIISLRPNMFELCDRLVGIYKTYNCTKSIAIDPRLYDNPTQNAGPQIQNSVAPENANPESIRENRIPASQTGNNQNPDIPLGNVENQDVIPDSLSEGSVADQDVIPDSQNPSQKGSEENDEVIPDSFVEEMDVDL